MNHYKARQKKSNGRWNYTCANDGKVYAVGACAEHHEAGHATAEEACACYRSWLLATDLKFRDPENPREKRKCEAPECAEWTGGSASVDMGSNHWALCKEHRTREVVEKLMPQIGESWGSW